MVRSRGKLAVGPNGDKSCQSAAVQCSLLSCSLHRVRCACVVDVLRGMFGADCRSAGQQATVVRVWPLQPSPRETDGVRKRRVSL